MTKNLSSKIGAVSLIGVNTIQDSSHYQNDPLSVYQLLCYQQQHNILLESAEIDKKHLLKSLLLTDAAVKIVCNGHSVTFTALTLNGESALDFAVAQLEHYANITLADDGKSFQAIFSEVTKDLDEKARLSATNPLHSLRLFNQLTDDKSHPFSVFLGGVFAFDLMAIAEQLPTVVDGDNTCPDFVYYLAETLVIIDHELQSTEIIGNVFNYNNAEKSKQSQLAISNRVAHIKETLARYIDAKQVSKLSPSFADIADKNAFNEQLQVDISDKR
ncbi:MAG: anthranilate synthase component 1, partial [Colwellia sp.]